MQQQQETVRFSLFQAETGLKYQNRHQQFVSKQQYLQISEDKVNEIQNQRPGSLELELPDELEIPGLSLYQVQIFASGYALSTSDGTVTESKNKHLFYRGIVTNDPKSIAVVTFIEDQVRILISKGHSNYRIHQVENGPYVFFDDVDLKLTNEYDCMTDDIDVQLVHQKEQPEKQRSVLSGNCVEIYFECDYESYQDNGSSVSNTESWVASLFNEVSTLYANENIPITISEVLVWNTPDVYQGLGSTGAVLDSFKRHRNNTGFNGRLAHFLSTRGLGGGIAYVNVLCSNFSNYAVSASLGTNIVPFPNYSWNVNVVAHEMGHNFGSPHTHSCSWNGNGTQIDDCGNQYLYNTGQNYGSCFDQSNPIIPNDGSVMSYCHLSTGNGISFNVGFGPQPGDLIYDRYVSSSCNTGTCNAPNCVSLANPQNGATGVLIGSDITWENESGASGYRITVGTEPTGGSITNNEDVGLTNIYDPGTLPFNTMIYVKVIPYNNLGDATNCSTYSFTTEANIPPSCTALTVPLNGATNVNTDLQISWAESSGFETGYKLRIGSTPGGNEIFPNTDVGNVTTYDPGVLPTSSTIYVQITPYGTAGDTEGCQEESFTTNNQLVYCESAGNNANFEWISNFQIGTFIKASENQGYSNYTGDTIQLNSGETYPVSITPDFSQQTYQEYYKIWIDFNRDGDFTDAGEQLFNAGPSNSSVSGNISIPAEINELTTRMRVSMKWNASQSSCENFGYGEVEDYTVKFSSGIPCNLVTNTNESGPGSFLYALDCVQPGDTIFFSSNIANQVIDLTQTFVVIDEPLSMIAAPVDNISVCGLSTDRVFDIRSGGVAFIEGIHIISGLSPNASAILNAGTVILKDVLISPHPNLTPNAVFIENTGSIEIRNSVDMQSGN
jgi:hypothetical protein